VKLYQQVHKQREITINDKELDNIIGLIKSDLKGLNFSSQRDIVTHVIDNVVATPNVLHVTGVLPCVPNIEESDVQGTTYYSANLNTKSYVKFKTIGRNCWFTKRRKINVIYRPHQNEVLIANYPFATIDPAVGVVGVPDSRLETLSAISGSQQILPAVVEFVDIAGLVEGASSGEGLGNKFLANIRETDMIAEVVRIFEDEDIHHVAGRIDPLGDIEVINLELVLADAETVEKRLGNVERDAKRGDKDAVLERDLLTRLKPHLDNGNLANQLEMTDDEKKLVKNLHLLTMKPFLYVCNRKNGSYNLDEQNDDRWQELVHFFEKTGSEYVVVDAGMEHELRDLSEDEKNDFRREYGAQDSGVGTLIRACYHRLGLMSYFTTGEKETRAWTVPQGSTDQKRPPLSILILKRNTSVLKSSPLKTSSPLDR
jgi:GTP-binding protein YchF